MSKSRVLITGATGFVGCRLAEVLAREQSSDILCLIHSWHKGARLARMSIQMVQGDLADQASLREAMRNCDVVFHCALDSSSDGPSLRQAMIDHTTNVMEAALAENVKRVVYLSSTAVYGFWPNTSPVTEETPTPYTASAYSDGKIDCENVAMKFHRERGLGVVILRPTMVYGPFETFWAAHLIRCLGRNWMTLINGGSGICNSLYIDNLISAMLRAADEDAAVGQVFIISDGATVTWREMIEGHAVAVKGCRLPLPDATVEEITAARTAAERGQNPSSLRAMVRLVRNPETRKALRTVPVLATAEKVARSVMDYVPDNVLQFAKRVAGSGNGTNQRGNGLVGLSKPPTIPLSEHDTRFFTCNVVFSIEKARKLLGYEPLVDFSEGIHRTAEWIRWMKL